MQSLNKFLYSIRKSGYGGTFRILKQKNKRKRKIIKICFFYQDKAVWDKNKALYEALKQDCRFETFVLVIPNRDLEISQEQYETITMHENAICAQNPYTKEWFDLKAAEVDFVFYAKPYAILLPECYWGSIVSRYAKVCYIPYGYQNWKLPVGLDKEFFRNVSLFFADDTYSKEIVQKYFPVSTLLGIRKIYDVGYPALADMHLKKEKKDTTPWWNERTDIFKVMWTPRWTTDEDMGGTGFFQYKDFMIEYFRNENESSLVFRPHPLAFSNWISSGEMTETEVNDYLQNFEHFSNMFYDNQGTYQNTFWKSDVLVTDYSSIIIEYFFTKKPIIYCSKDLSIFNEISQEMMKTCYLVDSREEMLSTLQHLKKGIDPLKEKREKLVELLLQKHNELTVPNMIKAIAEEM